MWTMRFDTAVEENNRTRVVPYNAPKAIVWASHVIAHGFIMFLVCKYPSNAAARAGQLNKRTQSHNCPNACEVTLQSDSPTATKYCTTNLSAYVIWYMRYTTWWMFILSGGCLFMSSLIGFLSVDADVSLDGPQPQCLTSHYWLSLVGYFVGCWCNVNEYFSLCMLKWLFHICTFWSVGTLAITERALIKKITYELWWFIFVH